MIYAPPSGFLGFVFFIFCVWILYYFFVKIPKQEKKLNKQSIAFAKEKFLQNTEAQAYIQDGYEIKNIIDKGNGIYKFELSKKVNHS